MTWPGTAVLALAVLTMARAGVRTVVTAVQRGSVLPAAQLLPGAVVLATDVRILFPVSGLLTVTVPVIVMVPPTGMLPVQVAVVPPTVSVPDDAVWSPLLVASSNTPARLVETVIPV